ncbi:MAG: helix-turn-helix domain-containing protein [Zoogloeaceae bacterium]|nr:helix-turn-helix domain-containing protein [Zoogloeaceae bacterium]
MTDAHATTPASDGARRVRTAMLALSAAGVRTADLARLLGRSRMTIYNWQSCRHPPAGDVEPRLFAAARRAYALLQSGVLPVRLRREERFAVLKMLLCDDASAPNQQEQ